MKIPLFTFATFVTAPPAAKLSCVSELKHADPYDPRTDWWKQLREFIPRNHRDGGTNEDLRAFVDQVTGRKEASYDARASAYEDWWASRNIRWTGGSSVTWKFGTAEVNINPELFVSVDGVRHAVKLYFKSTERLTADRASVVLRLLELAYRGGSSPAGRPVVGVLDLAQGDFHSPVISLAYLDPLLAGEAASFASIWREV
jgi:hypothetical protein